MMILQKPARICEPAREAKDGREEASRLVESNHAPAPGIMPEPVRVHEVE